MTNKSTKKPRHIMPRPKRQTVLFFFVLMLSSGLMYLDIALRHGF